jgi:hypothetical protein
MFGLPPRIGLAERARARSRQLRCAHIGTVYFRSQGQSWTELISFADGADTVLVVRLPALFAAILACVAVVSPASGAETQLAKFQLVTKPISTRTTDAPPKGPSVGDKLHERTRLFNEVPQFGKPARAAVGHDRGTYTVVSRTTVRVEGVTTLPGGTLVLRGILRTNLRRQELTAPVVAGTGRFAGARGTLRVFQRANPPRTLNVYTLTYR